MSGDEALSLTELARRLGVGASTISNWRSRHEDFPGTNVVGSVEMVELGAARSWLSSRRIPARSRRPDEREGDTYAQRLDPGSAPAEQGPDLAGARRGELELFDLMDDLRGSLDHRHTFDLLLGLAYVREWQTSLWKDTLHGLDTRQRLSLATAGPRGGDLRLFDDAVLALPHRLLHELSQTLERSWPPAAAGAGAVARHLGHLLDRLARRSWTADVVTPSSVVTLMLRIVEPRSNEYLHDLFGRSGEFAAGAVRERASGGEHAADLQTTCWVPGPAAGRSELLVAANLGLRTHVQVGGPPDSARSDGADIVVGNPPFNTGVLNADSMTWRYGSPRGRSDLGWLQLAVAMLARGGRAAVLTGHNATFAGRPAERDIRAAMLTDGVVDAVIALPPALFAPMTGIPVVLWVLRAPRPVRERQPVLFIDGTELGHQHRRYRDLQADDLERLVRAFRAGRGAAEDGFAAARSFDDIAAGDFVLNPRQMVPPRRVVTASPKGLAEVDDLLDRAASLGDTDTVRDIRAAVAQLRVADPRGAGRQVSLGDVGQILLGRPLSTPGAGGELPVLVPRNIRGYALSPHVSAMSADTGKSVVLRSGDVVGTRVGEIGRFALVTDEHDGWLLGPGCLAIRIGGAGGVDVRYLTFVLLGRAVQDWLDRRSGGSAVRNISATVLRTLPLLLPDLAEQRAVGTAFDQLAGTAERATRLAELANQLVALSADAQPGTGVAPADTHRPRADHEQLGLT